MRPQVVLWVVAFLLWYSLYASFYLPFVSRSSCIIVVAELVVFLCVWLTAVTALAYAAFTRPALIPSEYHVPDDVFEEEANEIAAAQAALLDEDESDASAPMANGWECIYHRIAGLVRERSLDVRLNPIALSNGTVLLCPSFCRKCKVIKPSRAHHCSRCDKCILRLDHHCPSIGACVHLHNHKIFLVFLAWATVLCLFGGATALPTLLSFDYGKMFDDDGLLLLDPFPEFFALSMTAGGMATALVCPIVLVCFQVSLWRMLLRNETSLESAEHDTFGDGGMFGNGMPNYDIASKRANVASVFGENVWLWPLPVPSAPMNSIA